jgi:hypothetical protein
MKTALKIDCEGVALSVLMVHTLLHSRAGALAGRRSSRLRGMRAPSFPSLRSRGVRKRARASWREQREKRPCV